MFTNWLLYDINICPFLNLTKAERTQKWGKTQLTYFSRPQLQFFFYFVWTYDSHKFRRGKQMERPVIGFWRLSFVRTRPTSPTRKTHGDTSPVETEDAVEYSPWHYFVAESQLFLWPRVLTNFNFGPQTSHPTVRLWPKYVKIGTSGEHASKSTQTSNGTPLDRVASKPRPIICTIWAHDRKINRRCYPVRPRALDNEIVVKEGWVIIVWGRAHDKAMGNCFCHLSSTGSVKS